MGQGARIQLGVACAALALTLPAEAAGGSGCANADTPADSASVDALREAVVCLVNQQRTARGIPALNASSKLDRAAQGWTNSMVASGRFEHGNFTGRFDAVHYDWQSAGENIATGYATPRRAVAAWMASPDHCRNVLDPSFRDIGTGERYAPVRGWASGPATWTQDFGLQMSQSARSRNRGPASGCPYR
jgi:uncharacterized protein YkwD